MGEVEVLLIEEEEEVPLFICFSISAFSSSVIIVVATDVMSFMMDISPICGKRGMKMTIGAVWSDGETHVVHEPLASEDVGEESSGVIDVDGAFFVNLEEGRWFRFDHP